MLSKRFYRYLLLSVLLLASLYLVHIIVVNEAKGNELQKGIADDIIRFHVVANSNSYDDQMIKYKVKDALVKELSSSLEKAQSKDEALDIIEDNLSNIALIARNVLDNNDCDNEVSVTIRDSYFPMKAYGVYTFPPGIYQALQVEIGKSKGENWWCVLFPPLCFVDETYSIVDKETDKQLQYLLTDEEYYEILNEDITVKYKFKLWEMFKEWVSP